MLAIALLFVFHCARAHIEMTSPLPFRSRFIGISPLPPSTDFSQTSPLNSDGSNFPCKGYHSDLDTTPISATLTAGSSLDVALAGSATHNGGSCEFSVSYDKGKTWAVIARQVGNCPIDQNISIDIPSDLPSSKKALFAWTWQNFSGNRELYMNCAPVAISNPGGSKSYTAPSLFRVNTFPDGTCISQEGINIQYPHVNAVKTIFKSGMSASSPVTEIANCPIDLSKIITVTGDGSVVDGGDSGGSETTSQEDKPAGSAPKEDANKTATKQVDATTQDTKAPSSTQVTRSKSQTQIVDAQPPAATFVQSPPADTPSDGCVAGTIKCSEDGHGWSMCSNGIYLDMNGVAAGMLCKNSKFIRDPSFARLRHRSHMKRLSHRK